VGSAQKKIFVCTWFQDTHDLTYY